MFGENYRVALAGPRPTVNRLHPRKQGQHRDSHERKRPAAGFEDSPDYQSPVPSGEMLDHQQRKTAKRYANPEEECH
jgi:hypothetical protein